MKYVSIIFLFLFVACSEEDPELPLCFDPIFEEFKMEACSGDDLTTWELDGELVYCFLYGSCQADRGAEIYSADCTYLCTLGGLAGNTECQGLDWASNAVFIETLYVQ